MKRHNVGFDLKATIAEINGLDRAVLQILRHCIGRNSAMSRKDLIHFLQQNPVYADVNERKVRLAITELRKTGQALICSTGGKGGGYWIASSWDEVDDFFENEVDPRIKGLSSTKKAMKQAAGRILGPKPEAKQERLFE